MTKKDKIQKNSWTIKGVSQEVRSAAKKAADKRDEFLGAWVERVLHEAAQRELTNKQEVARQEDNQLPEIVKKFEEQFLAINEKLNQISIKKTLADHFFDIFTKRT
jgi:hypothetical protein